MLSGQRHRRIHTALAGGFTVKPKLPGLHLLPPGQCAVYTGHFGEYLCCKDQNGIFRCNRLKFPQPWL